MFTSTSRNPTKTPQQPTPHDAPSPFRRIQSPPPSPPLLHHQSPNGRNCYSTRSTRTSMYKTHRHNINARNKIQTRVLIQGRRGCHDRRCSTRRRRSVWNWSRWRWKLGTREGLFGFLIKAIFKSQLQAVLVNRSCDICRDRSNSKKLNPPDDIAIAQKNP